MTKKQGVPRRRASVLSIALVVAVAFGAIAASGAQALDWQNYGTSVLSGTSSETVAGTGSGFRITSSLLGAAVETSCSSATTSGSIVAGGTGSSTIALGGCTVSKPAHCTLAYQPTLTANIEEVQVGGVLFQKFVPNGTKFGTLEFAGAECALSGNSAALKGSFAGRELSSGLTTNHSLSFNKTEPWPAVELKFGGFQASMSGEVTQHLSGNIANHGWRAIWQETHGGWEVESGSPFTFPQSAIVSGGPVTFSFSTGGAPVSFSCSGSSATEAALKPGGTETVSGLTFTGCSVEKPAGCTLSGNQLVFASVTGTLVRVNGNIYEKFTATNPENSLTTISIEGAFCALGGHQYAVKGSFAGIGREFGLLRVNQALEFSKAASEATGSQLTSGSIGINMAGSINQKLSGSTLWGAY